MIAAAPVATTTPSLGSLGRQHNQLAIRLDFKEIRINGQS